MEPVGHPEWPFHGVGLGDYRDVLKCLKLSSSWERTSRYFRSNVELHVRSCGCIVARGTPRGCAMTSAAPADHFQDCGWHRGGRSGVKGRVGNAPRTPRLACPLLGNRWPGLCDQMVPSPCRTDDRRDYSEKLLRLQWVLF